MNYFFVGFWATTHVDKVSQAAPAVLYAALIGSGPLAPSVLLDRIVKSHSIESVHEDLFVIVIYQCWVLQVMDFVAMNGHFLELLDFALVLRHRCFDLDPVRICFFFIDVNEEILINLNARLVLRQFLSLLIPSSSKEIITALHAIDIALHDRNRLERIIIMSHRPHVELWHLI